MTNRTAFLYMIAVSEIGNDLMEISDDGYNVIVGSTVENPDLFQDYSDHPRKDVKLPNGLSSTAAGRYQILAHIFDSYKAILNLPDFSPASQDLIALRLINECGATADVDNGDLAEAVTKCVSRWASLPGSDYGQHEQKIAMLQQAYIDAGGTISEV